MYVIKGENGLYIAANILDSELWTDGEKWSKGDMGQKGNNDDFIIYLTDTNTADRTTICLSSANLLRVYANGIGLGSNDVTLELNNLVYNKKVKNYEYHVTTSGLTNGGASNGLTLELYISYEDLGIENPDQIKMCFNYNDISASGNTKSAEDNYFVNGTATDNAEENIGLYFSINDLIK